MQLSKVLMSSLVILAACTPAPMDTASQENMTQDKTQEGSKSPTDAASSHALGQGLPDDIEGFQSWFKINSDPIPHSAAAPHTPSQGDKNIYLNQDALPSEYPFAEGTIIVKESLHKSEPYVEWVSIMRKIKDLDPEHGDWEFHEYIRSGPDEEFKLAYQGATCFGCHSSAKDSADWVRYLGDKQ